MKNIQFNKKCNVTTLTQELAAAGFDIFGCTNADMLTIVHMKDTETKDPTAIVNAHIFTAPIEKTPADWKNDLDTAATVADKIAVIKKYLFGG